MRDNYAKWNKNNVDGSGGPMLQMKNKSLENLPKINRPSDRDFSRSRKWIRDEHATTFGPDEGGISAHTKYGLMARVRVLTGGGTPHIIQTGSRHTQTHSRSNHPSADVTPRFHLGPRSEIRGVLHPDPYTRCSSSSKVFCLTQIS
jgi:hypothetical protein